MLHDLQRGFADAALTKSLDALLPHVAAARGSKERRLEVYHANTLNSLTDVLAAAYPVVQRIVGDRFFSAAAKAYVQAHPPRQPTLFRYGATLGDFLVDFAPAKDLPYLPDVARLEWARVAAYFAADSDPLAPQDLAALPPEKTGLLTFTLHPATQLVTSPFPVFTIWSVNQPDQDTVPKIDFDEPECGMVGRQAHTVFQRRLSAGAYLWLEALARGETLETATEQASASDSAFDLQDTLRQQLADGTFSSFDV